MASEAHYLEVVAPQYENPVADDAVFDTAMRKFSDGLDKMGERGQHSDVAALTESLVRAIEQSGSRRALHGTRLTQYLSMAVSIIAILTIVFYAGTWTEKISSLEKSIEVLQNDVRTLQAQVLDQRRR